MLSGIVICALFLILTTQAENKYVGVKKCMACHKIEKMGGLAYTVWEKSAHAKAYQTLLGDEAKKIAKEKGLTTAPAENEACLKCHVTGGAAAKNVDVGYKKEEGVTCEACHGAASGYINLHNKKTPEDKAKAKAAGFMAVDKTNSKLCETCHNSGSPTFKGFKMSEMWAKIEHSGPPKK
jgi:hypothetical protein